MTTPILISQCAGTSNLPCCWSFPALHGCSLLLIAQMAGGNYSINPSWNSSQFIGGGGSTTCTGADFYVTWTGSQFQIAIWDAYVAGKWSSSCTIGIFHFISGGGSGITAEAVAGTGGSTCAQQNKSYTANSSPSSCPVSTLKATITVLDNGTFTLT